MDTTDPAIRFDSNGVCNHCINYLERMQAEVPGAAEARRLLDRAINQIGDSGRNLEYDCVAGISGGMDSTYVVLQLKRLGLRPLAVHFDNGWNSELAVTNIKRTLDKLGVELHTEVVDWEEFRELQISFLKASVPNCEIPTDHGITATLVRTAAKVGTPYVVNGSNVRTEGILPISWVFYSHDLRHIHDIHRRFSSSSLKTFPQLPLGIFAWKILSGRYRMFNLLNFLPYERQSVIHDLEQSVGWQNYGGKHYESVYTRWYQGYYLPAKFGFDKRKAHLSALLCSGQITRCAAIEALERSPYESLDLRADVEFVLNKLQLSEAEFESILNAPNRTHLEYRNSAWMIERMSRLRVFLRQRAKRI